MKAKLTKTLVFTSYDAIFPEGSEIEVTKDPFGTYTATAKWDGDSCWFSINEENFTLL